MRTIQKTLYADGVVRNIKNIPAPVSDVSCTITHSTPVRVSKSLDYIKTDKRWLVELRFNSNYELALFERFLIGTPMRLAEYQGKHDRSPRYFVIDSRIPDNATGDEVEKWMSEELPSVSAAMAIHFPMFLPPTIWCFVDVEELAKGKGPWRKGEMALILGTNSDPIVMALLKDGTDLISPYIAKCSSDADFREAAMYCGQALGFRGGNPWANLYRSFEIVADRFGGDAGISEGLKCCSKTKISRFTRTLNHQEAIGKFSRHARLNTVPPPEPMSFEESVEFVLALLKAWQEYTGVSESGSA